MISTRGRWALAVLGLGLGLAAVLVTGLPAQAQSDDTDDSDVEEKVSVEPTMTVTLDITESVPRSSFTLRGRVVSVIHGRDRSGQTATAEDIDPRASAEAQQSLEDLGAERTPDGLVLTLPETVLFEFDSSEVVSEADEIIERVAELLDFFSDVEVEIRGHTDSRGSVEYNQGLSEDRAAAVLDALVGAGANRSQMTPIGFGQTQPVAPNETETGADNPEGRAQNRRVEIVLKEN